MSTALRPPMSIPSSSVVVELRMFRSPTLNRSCSSRFRWGDNWALCSSAQRPRLKTVECWNSRAACRPGGLRREPRERSARGRYSRTPAQPSTDRGQICPVFGHRWGWRGRRRPNAGKTMRTASTDPAVVSFCSACSQAIPPLAASRSCRKATRSSSGARASDSGPIPADAGPPPQTGAAAARPSHRPSGSTPSRRPATRHTTVR